jgi:hypothetical protein
MMRNNKIGYIWRVKNPKKLEMPMMAIAMHSRSRSGATYLKTGDLHVAPSCCGSPASTIRPPGRQRLNGTNV